MASGIWLGQADFPIAHRFHHPRVVLVREGLRRPFSDGGLGEEIGVDAAGQN